MHAASDPRLTLGRFLRDVCEAQRGRRALVFEGRELGYDEVEAQSLALARAMLGAGVVKGSRVALCMGNRPEWIAACFAAGMLGAVLVPVNTFATRAERDYVLRHGDASLLLLQRELRSQHFLSELCADHPEIAGGVPGRLRCAALPQLRRVACLDLAAPQGGVEAWPDFLAHASDVPAALVAACCDEVEPAEDALIVYTSGSTAEPKAVLHTQRTLALQARRYVDFLRLERDDVIFTTYPFFWTAGIAMSLGGSFAAGATLVVQQAFDPAEGIALIERLRVSVLHAWPHQQRALAEQPGLAGRDLRALRKLDFSSPLARQAGIREDRYGYGASYGLSETCTFATALPADAPAAARRESHGVPNPGMEFRILDPESGEALPPGRPGEIALRGVALMRGYHKLPREAAFDADGFFRTRDGGWLDAEGRLHWTGRLSNLLKTGGANVSPLEIERVLEKFPGLKAGVAVGVPHPTLGEAIVLCAVPQDGVSLAAEPLQAFLREQLAAYKRPRAVLFFSAAELSYTANQKIQVGPLRELAAARLARDGVVIEGHRYGAQPDALAARSRA